MIAGHWAELQKDLARRTAQRLFDNLTDAQVNHEGRQLTTLSASLVLAYAIAVIVYGVALSLLAAGLYLIWRWGWRNLWLSGLGVMLVLMAWLARPHGASPPHGLVTRAQCPALFVLIDRITQALKANPLAGVAITPDFNASYRICGWRQAPYMELGLPLLLALSPQERVALIAHELSHGVNGDPMRGRLLFGSVGSLVQWGVSLRPLSIGQAGNGQPMGPLVSLVAIPFEMTLLLLSELLIRSALGVQTLVLHESQRAEYFADRLAASVASSAAMASGLEKLYLIDEADAAIRRVALTGAEEPLSGIVSQAIGRVDAQTLERHRAESRAKLHQVDATHPPTALRVEMLRRRRLLDATVELSSHENRQIDDELAALTPAIRQELINRHLMYAYGG